jgi:hypothetical protein
MRRTREQRRKAKEGLNREVRPKPQTTTQNKTLDDNLGTIRVTTNNPPSTFTTTVLKKVESDAEHDARLIPNFTQSPIQTSYPSSAPKHLGRAESALSPSGLLDPP